jgi:four helix bundle protein
VRRDTLTEFIQFLYIALGSLSELETQIIISYNLDYTSENKLSSICSELTTIRNMILGLAKFIKSKN